MITTYWYQNQIKTYMIQFAQIFAGLQVATGNGACDTPEMITVPIRVGSRDRVVAALESGNTQNRPLSLPMMVMNLINIRLAPERRKNIGGVDRRTALPEGGVFPDDLKVVERLMPVPYNLELELAMFASNTDQAHQMLEQILLLFDPILQIQKNDAAFDWTKITTVELTNINNEENYPAGVDRRLIAWNLTFDLPIYISSPMNIKKEIVRTISIQIGDTSGFTIDEYDTDGNLVSFLPGFDYGTVTIES